MTTRFLAASALAAALFTVPGIVQAQAQAAVTASAVNLRAGPDTDYPVVAVLPAGFSIAVQGCLPEYTWCDVVAGHSRGWMHAGYINYYYQNRYVPLQNYGAVLGIGALAFVLSDYWGDHYRDRPWYGERRHWSDRHRPRYEPRHSRRDWERDRPRAERRGGDHLRPRDYVTRPGEVAPRAEQRPSGRPNPGVTRQEQHELNQGGSSSVDPRLRPNY